MCAMDRSGDGGLSQSVRDALFHIKELYHSSPVSVCVRSSDREFLYQNTSFEQLYAYLLNKDISNIKNIVPLEVEVFLARLEIECGFLGNGGVLNKSFSNKGTSFNVYMECRQTEDGEIIILWMLNLLIIRPLAGFRVLDRELHSKNKFDKLVSNLTDKNLIVLSFYMSGYDVSEISMAMKIEAKTIESRIERTKKIIKKYYPSFIHFKYECFRNKSIYFFVALTMDYVLLEVC
ncbi:TPA: hypothetical protein ACNGYJ_004975 [Klebsiella quasipneumoniae subsp. quasipneumoniae]